MDDKEMHELDPEHLEHAVERSLDLETPTFGDIDELTGSTCGAAVKRRLMHKAECCGKVITKTFDLGWRIWTRNVSF